MEAEEGVAVGVMEVDDGDLLHAVLAFLKDNDAIDVMGETSDSYGSSQSDTESRNGSSSPKKISPSEPQTVLPRLTPRRPKVNKSRQRMREETVALREQVLELQDRLESIQGGVASRVGIFPKNSLAAAEEKEARKLRALAWQAIAEHENLKKVSAETEREKLKALLKEQKLAFRRLRRYLGKYSAGSQWAPLKEELLIDGDRDEVPMSAPTASQTADFDEISKTIPTMYLQTSAVFADQRLETLTSSMHELKVQNELTTQMSIESLDSRLVPFDLNQTARAVWEYHLNKVRKISDQDDHQKLEESENTIRRVFSAGIQLTGLTGQAQVRMETRRFVEPQRVVIVQSAVYDHMEVNKAQVDRFALRQYQWTVIGPPRNAALRASGKAMTQVEVFEVTLPVLDHVSGLARPHLLQRVKSLCTETATLHMEIERESVECILMDSLLQHSSLDASMLALPTA